MSLKANVKIYKFLSKYGNISTTRQGNILELLIAHIFQVVPFCILY